MATFLNECGSYEYSEYSWKKTNRDGKNILYKLYSPFEKIS